MKKLMTILLVSMGLLAGCSEEAPPKVIGTFEEVTVKEKKEEKECFRGCTYDYSVVFDKDGQEVELQVDKGAMYKALKKGTVVTVTYDEYYYVDKIKFTEIENNVDKDKK